MANNWGADREADMESGVPTIVHAQAVEGNVSIQAEDYEKQVSQRSLWGYSLIDRFAVMLHLRSLPVCCTLTRPPTYILFYHSICLFRETCLLLLPSPTTKTGTLWWVATAAEARGGRWPWCAAQADRLVS